MPLPLSRSRVVSPIAVLVLLAAFVWPGGGTASAQEASNLTEVGEAAEFGPWSMTVAEVLTGGDAQAASAENPGLNAGLQYVAARIVAENRSQAPVLIGVDDFGAIGDAGLIRRAAGVFPPEPALNAEVAAGDSTEGWILTAVEDDTSSIVLLYDSVTITGTWADHAFALTDDATYVGSQERAAELDRAGREPGQPVGVGQLLSTPEWTIQIVDVVTGTAVLDIAPEPTMRLAQSYTANGYDACFETWIALRIDATNNGGDGLTRFLSPTAFRLAEPDGSPTPDVRILTAPAPDLAGAYAAGATRTGWISYELPSLCDVGVVNLLYTANLIRFQPFSTSDDPRFLTWDANFVAAEETPTPEPFDPAIALPAGTIAVTNEFGVRLREEPSVDGEIIVELDRDVEVEITGAFQEGGGYFWYPVEVVETGEAGWIAQDFLDAAD